jgi:hypothetical protein
MSTAAVTPNQQMTPQQVNGIQRKLVLSKSVNMDQLLNSQTINPANQNIISVNPRNVGLIKKFTVRITGTVTNTDGALALSLTDFGLSNILRNILFTDYTNNQRINTAGWHLTALNSCKHKKPFASGWAVETDQMQNTGETYPIITAPASIAHGAAASIAAVFEIPLAYSDDDLRGAVYANLLNSTATLQLTFATAAQMFTAAGVDSTLAVYSGTASATFTNVTISIYQNYLDQLPIGNQGVILPTLDLSTFYEIKNTTFNAISANNEYQIPYSNYRDFLSTIVIYNHDTTADAGRVAGTDINYWALQSSNLTYIWRKDPYVQSLMTRQILNCDLPKGMYYMSSRRKPISTTQYGNMELILNPSTATANAIALVGWEDLGYQNTLTQAGSLA